MEAKVRNKTLHFCSIRNATHFLLFNIAYRNQVSQHVYHCKLEATFIHSPFFSSYSSVHTTLTSSIETEPSEWQIHKSAPNAGGKEKPSTCQLQ